jgi:hypothetical protein
MHIIGVVEIAVGIAVFSQWTLIGSLVAAGWLVAIALNLIAARDLVLAVAAYTLACLTAQHAAPAAYAEQVPQRPERVAGARTAA